MSAMDWGFYDPRNDKPEGWEDEPEVMQKKSKNKFKNMYVPAGVDWFAPKDGTVAAQFEPSQSAQASVPWYEVPAVSAASQYPPYQSQRAGTDANQRSDPNTSPFASQSQSTGFSSSQTQPIWGAHSKQHQVGRDNRSNGYGQGYQNNSGFSAGPSNGNAWYMPPSIPSQVPTQYSTEDSGFSHDLSREFASVSIPSPQPLPYRATSTFASLSSVTQSSSSSPSQDSAESSSSTTPNNAASTSNSSANAASDSASLSTQTQASLSISSTQETSTAENGEKKPTNNEQEVEKPKESSEGEKSTAVASNANESSQSMSQSSSSVNSTSINDEKNATEASQTSGDWWSLPPNYQSTESSQRRGGTHQNQAYQVQGNDQSTHHQFQSQRRQRKQRGAFRQLFGTQGTASNVPLDPGTREYEANRMNSRVSSYVDQKLAKQEVNNAVRNVTFDDGDQFQFALYGETEKVDGPESLGDYW